MQKKSSPFTFVMQHPAASILAAVGVLMGTLGYAQQGMELWKEGAPAWALQAGGFALFVVSIVMLLYRWDKERVASPTTKEPGENPRLDLLFGAHDHEANPTLMRNIFSWHVQGHALQMTMATGEVETLRHTYLMIVFRDDVFPRHVTCEGRDIPPYEVKSRDQKHVFLSISGGLAGRSISVRVNENDPSPRA